MIPIAAAPVVAYAVRHVEPVAVAPAARPVAKIATSAATVGPGASPPAVVLAIDNIAVDTVTITETAVALTAIKLASSTRFVSIAASEVTVSAELVATIHIAVATREIALSRAIGFAEFTPLARLSRAILPHAQKITHLFVRRTPRLVFAHCLALLAAVAEALDTTRGSHRLCGAPLERLPIERWATLDRTTTRRSQFTGSPLQRLTIKRWPPLH
jgi:hypothetical protein